MLNKSMLSAISKHMILHGAHMCKTKAAIKTVTDLLATIPKLEESQQGRQFNAIKTYR